MIEDIIVSVKDLNFNYKKDKKILDNINIDIKKGLNFILGENGAGKTTFMKCLLGLLKTEDRVIKVNGDMSYIPQANTPTFNHLVIDVVVMGIAGKLKFYEVPSKSHINKAMEILEKLNIKDLAYRGYAQISGGQRQLVLIARALIQDSRVLIMDEPCSDLDYGNEMLLMFELKKLVERGYTIIMSSHNPQMATWFSDYIIFISDGKIEAYGKPYDVMTEDRLKKVYKHDIKIMKNIVDGREYINFYPSI